MAILVAVLIPDKQANSAPNPSSPFAAPIETTLKQANPSPGSNQESITVIGRRPFFQNAPTPDYGDSRAPWEIGKAIRDTMTGANTASFGNAYNLGSTMGSDERSNETGGQFIAPRHN